LYLMEVIRVNSRGRGDYDELTSILFIRSSGP
jgi:hypothetical protein